MTAQTIAPGSRIRGSGSQAGALHSLSEGSNLMTKTVINQAVQTQLSVSGTLVMACDFSSKKPEVWAIVFVYYFTFRPRVAECHCLEVWNNAGSSMIKS